MASTPDLSEEFSTTEVDDFNLGDSLEIALRKLEKELDATLTTRTIADASTSVHSAHNSDAHTACDVRGPNFFFSVYCDL